MKYSAIKLKGPWKEGYALDKHVIKSEYIGDNEFGNPIFDTYRSDLGQLMFELKYRSNIETVNEIVGVIRHFLNNHWDILNIIDLIVPIPPSKKDRRMQPVFEICKGLSSSLNIPFDVEVLNKTNKEQIKNLDQEEKMKNIANSLSINLSTDKKINILLIDDLYDYGTTLERATKLLKEHDSVNDVFVLTITKTKRIRGI